LPLIMAGFHTKKLVLAPLLWRRGGPRGRGKGKDQGGPRRLGEVEIAHEVAELRRVLPDVGPGIGPAVGGGVEALSSEEQVLDELHVGVVGQDLVVDRS